MQQWLQVHLAPGSKFDFQKYIKRSLEDDFKVIVGISPPLWASALIFLLLNVNGWHTMLWISIMPVVIILSVGTKLQGIICRMAIDITERHAVIQGIPLVQVSDSYFWFARPTFVLFLIHFTLFQVRLIACITCSLLVTNNIASCCCCCCCCCCC
jgi:mlo protein